MGNGEHKTYRPSGRRALSKYSKDQRVILTSVPIVTFLESVGHTTRRGSTGLYYSFLRDEKNPSLHINDRENVWFDHGAGQGGGLIEAVKALVPGCAGDRDEPVLDYLRDTFHPGMIPANGDDVPSRSVSRERDASLEALRRSEAVKAAEIERRRAEGRGGQKRIRITRVATSFSSRLLLEYFVGKRRVPRTLLEHYCRQVHYRIRPEGADESQEGREYFAAGFPNRSGGWALRNAVTKFASGTDISIISADGRFLEGDCPEPTAGTVIVFEGFSDFLSWLAWNGKDAPTSLDAVVLNSTAKLKAAVPFCLSHGTVKACLDNDDSGREHTEALRRECEDAGVSFQDVAPLILPHNDLNEAWCAHCERLDRRKAEARRNAEQAVTAQGEGRGNALK